MQVSLILCTYNRCRSLANVLEDIVALSMPVPVDWEALVVDNNSKDQTRAVIDDFASRSQGRVRYVLESRQGLSHARNAGIDAAKGRVLAFTDDDVAIDSNWLEQLTRPLLDDQYDAVAGRILLGEFQRPKWLAINGPHNLGGSLVQFDLGDQPGKIDLAPFGASMAFQRSVFEKLGRFRTDLGRSGKSLIGNEDTEFGNRVLASGGRIGYAPLAVVYHPVLQERLTKRYFRAYWFSLGRAQVRQEGKRLPFLRVPRVYLADFRRRLRWMKADDPQWHRKPEGRFFCEVHALQMLGRIVEGFRLTLQSQSTAEKTLAKNPDLSQKAL